MRVRVDLELCESNGVCMGLAPEVFDLGDDDTLTVLPGDVPSAEEEPVRVAVRQCPRQAIFVDDESAATRNDF